MVVPNSRFVHSTGLVRNALLSAVVVQSVVGIPLCSGASESFLLESRLSEDFERHVLLHKKAMNEDHLTVLGMILGKHTLRDVEQKLGTAPRIHVGHEGIMLCYRSVVQN